MKNLIIPMLLIAGLISVHVPASLAASLQCPEGLSLQNQDNYPTATVRTATRFFREKDDLTSVMEIIPAGSVVLVLGKDSTYFHISYQDNDGYIFRKHADLDKAPEAFSDSQEGQQTEQEQPEQANTDERYAALVTKYGSSMADRLYAGKIWKGMNSGMVRDSWGTAERVNRVVSGNTIKEEWIYRSTWLYFENNTLVQWGPVKK